MTASVKSGKQTAIDKLANGLFRNDGDVYDPETKYRFLLIGAFHLQKAADLRTRGDSKTERLMNIAHLNPILDGVYWDFHIGPFAQYGDWPVENREEFTLVAADRLAIVRTACQTGRYNAIVLLGGGEPGAFEAREIAREYGIPVVSCGFSQMHIATMLGNKFSVLDVAEQHNMYYYSLIKRHRLADRCASVLNINLPHWRPGAPDPEMHLTAERERYYETNHSDVIEIAVQAAVEAIETDGAEVITMGCSGAFWMKWPMEERLKELGWEVPVLEGYSSALALAKMMVDLKIDASGLTFPSAHPKKIRTKKII
ncbi:MULTISPECIES: aspartate/glutamate racemase family protein [Pacificibacter]|uniref:aspartate/glutamate racemase family protein n=1 Tax=Pacificibacter TaxID=1042323 RepID=UPI001C0A586B|nr:MULTISPECIES: aspartate/glutamate racemase family protein [Pacificibacter]MBU2934547.1 hypothetical protein [Pacificibacter marinus]MDO6617331.1 aspartate/glutamate racemase family protein [Pacificibacter sp. 1_MG-2023]